MSSKADKLLQDSMSRRRPRETIQADVAESVLGEMVPVGVRDILISSLYRSPYQVQTPGSADYVADLAESIRTSGLLNYLVVREVKNPDPRLKLLPQTPAPETAYELVTGYHRSQAAILLGWAACPAEIKHLTDAQAALALTSDNALHRPLTDWDRYNYLKLLRDTNPGISSRQLAATLRISQAQVNALGAYDKLPEEARQLISTAPGICSYNLASALVSKGYAETAPALVVAALQRIVARQAAEPEGARITAEQTLSWIGGKLSSRTTAPSYRRELKISRPGHRPLKLRITPNSATLEAEGLNVDKLAALIESNLAELLATPQA